MFFFGSALFPFFTVAQDPVPISDPPMYASSSTSGLGESPSAIARLGATPTRSGSRGRGRGYGTPVVGGLTSTPRSLFRGLSVDDPVYCAGPVDLHSTPQPASSSSTRAPLVSFLLEHLVVAVFGNFNSIVRLVFFWAFFCRRR